jgi:ferric-dicitrate binding protein FerR (iron transport regulator)
MDTQDQKRLLEKFYTDGSQLSPQELKKLFLWLNSKRGTRELKQMLDNEWTKFEEGNDAPVNTSKMLNEIRDRIHRSKTGTRVRRRIIRYIPYAAAVLIAIITFAGLQFYMGRPPGLSHDVSLFYEYGALTNTLKRVVLPDGSKVVLFPGSSLIIPENFKKAPVRSAKLEGEAFFEIARNEKQPFVLHMGGIGVEVLGTSFNASNYHDDTDIEVVLKSGRVRLFQGDRLLQKKEVVLKPDHLARYVRGEDGFTIEKADVERYTSWVDGVLIFRDEPMKEVFRKLERWYGVKIEVLDPSVNEFIYTATIKNESLEQILRLIEYTSPVKCRLIREQDQSITKIYIQKNNDPV